MAEQSLEVIESNYNKLEDIKNSCESLVEKLGYLQVDLFNNPDKDLEKFLGEMNSKFSQLHQELVEVTTTYENTKLSPAKGLETFNSSEEE